MPVTRSIVQRLATSFALLGALVLLAMATGVYLSTAWLLQARHASELDRASRVVQHVILENASPKALDQMRHKLDDLLVGESNLTVSIMQLADGRALYDSTVFPVADTEMLERWLRIETRPDELGLVEVRLRLNVASDEQVLRSLGSTAAIAALTGAVVLGWLGALIAHRGLQPVRELAHALESWTPERGDEIGVHAVQAAELLPLIERFRTMLSEIRFAHAQLRSFNEDVAHELRTPLAALIGEAELAISKDRPALELVLTLERQLEAMRTLAKIVTDMLFLARAERSALARRATVASLASVAADVVDYFAAALEERALSARVDGDASARLDVALLKRALSNLLANAVHHATVGSEIVIEIRAERASDLVSIAVHNIGHTIDAEHLPRLFDRFYRTFASREDSTRHHGLGLAIVAAIARMHAGGTFATSSNGRTTVGLTIAVAGADSDDAQRAAPPSAMPRAHRREFSVDPGAG